VTWSSAHSIAILLPLTDDLKLIESAYCIPRRRLLRKYFLTSAASFLSGVQAGDSTFGLVVPGCIVEKCPLMFAGKISWAQEMVNTLGRKFGPDSTLVQFAF